MEISDWSFILFRGFSPGDLPCKTGVVSTAVLDSAATYSWDLAHRELLQHFSARYCVHFLFWPKCTSEVFDAVYPYDLFWRRGLRRLIFVGWVCRREWYCLRRGPLVFFWSCLCASDVSAKYVGWCFDCVLSRREGTFFLWLESLFCKELTFARFKYEYDLLFWFFVFKGIVVIHNFY